LQSFFFYDFLTHGQKYVLAIISCAFVTLFASLPLVEAAELPDLQSRASGISSDEVLPTAQTGSKPASPFVGLHIEAGIQYLKYHSLEEPRQFNPAASLMQSDPGTKWDHTWEEKRAYIGVSYDVYSSKHLLLRPGLILGTSKARFAADDNRHFSEEWKTRPAFLWGLALTGEVRQSANIGPFLRVKIMQSRASADEAEEHVTGGPDTSGQYRDARFRWRASEAFIELGYQWKALTLSSGAVYTDFRLWKWLSYHIPEAGARDVPIIQALNSTDSEYDFRNSAYWKPFFALDWKISPAWILSVAAKFGGYEDFRLALGLSL
jgi:hypothetical protein